MWTMSTLRREAEALGHADYLSDRLDEALARRDDPGAFADICTIVQLVARSALPEEVAVDLVARAACGLAPWSRSSRAFRESQALLYGWAASIQLTAAGVARTALQRASCVWLFEELMAQATGALSLLVPLLDTIELSELYLDARQLEAIFRPHPLWASPRLQDVPVPGLRHLALWGDDLDDDAASVLARLASLRGLAVLDLDDNRISDAGARVLAEASWPKLERLSLADNLVGPQGAAALAGLGCQLDLGEGVSPAQERA